jgi:hypothetical protein
VYDHAREAAQFPLEGRQQRAVLRSHAVQHVAGDIGHRDEVAPDRLGQRADQGDDEVLA